jgi:beta-phosphoglucomutase-like phosphatase (HAD superfamily)
MKMSRKVSAHERAKSEYFRRKGIGTAEREREKHVRGQMIPSIFKAFFLRFAQKSVSKIAASARVAREARDKVTSDDILLQIRM